MQVSWAGITALHMKIECYYTIVYQLGVVCISSWL